MDATQTDITNRVIPHILAHILGPAGLSFSSSLFPSDNFFLFLSMFKLSINHYYNLSVWAN